jgi:hypothetical protein
LAQAMSRTRPVMVSSSQSEESYCSRKTLTPGRRLVRGQANRLYVSVFGVG